MLARRLISWESPPHADTHNAAKPPQYEGFGDTPGGPRIPNLLIRGQALDSGDRRGTGDSAWCRLGSLWSRGFNGYWVVPGLIAGRCWFGRCVPESWFLCACSGWVTGSDSPQSMVAVGRSVLSGPGI